MYAEMNAAVNNFDPLGNKKSDELAEKPIEENVESTKVVGSAEEV